MVAQWAQGRPSGVARAAAKTTYPHSAWYCPVIRFWSVTWWACPSTQQVIGIVAGCSATTITVP